jgi:hypothetical protein
MSILTGNQNHFAVTAFLPVGGDTGFVAPEVPALIASILVSIQLGMFD